jgi:hypothetical protein
MLCALRSRDGLFHKPLGGMGNILGWWDCSVRYYLVEKELDVRSISQAFCRRMGVRDRATFRSQYGRWVQDPDGLTTSSDHMGGVL